MPARAFAGTPIIFDSDLPTVVTTANGRIVAMPFTMEVNDMPLYVRYGAEPEAFSRIFARIAGAWRSIPGAGGGQPGCIDLTVHAHVFGRPYGLVALTDAIEVARRTECAWLTDHAQLAEMCAAG